MVWNVPAESLGSLIIRLVTGNASRRKPLEPADRRALVAVFALQSCVRSEQRETILVILYLLHRNIPPLDGVAIRTIRAHLVLVHIDVAVLAILSHIGEDRFHVALAALDFLMHSAQRITRFVVVELGNRFNRPPSRGGVTVLTRDGQRPMRTLSITALTLRKSATYGPEKEQQPEREFEVSKRVSPPRAPLHLELSPSRGVLRRISNREL